MHRRKVAKIEAARRRLPDLAATAGAIRPFAIEPRMRFLDAVAYAAGFEDERVRVILAHGLFTARFPRHVAFTLEHFARAIDVWRGAGDERGAKWTRLLGILRSVTRTGLTGTDALRAEYTMWNERSRM